MLHVPLVIAGRFVLGSFKWIGAQVGQQGGAQFGEGLDPYVQAMCILAQEGGLPVVVAQCRNAAAVGPVEKLVTRPSTFSRQCR